MRRSELTEVLRTVRGRRPATLRSLVQVVEAPLARMLGADVCALQVYRPHAVYLSRRVSGLDERGLSALFGIDPGRVEDWTVIGRDEVALGPASGISVAGLPFYKGGIEAGRLYLLTGPGKSGPVDAETAELLSEVISMLAAPCISGVSASAGDNLRAELIEAAGDDGMMGGVLQGMMADADAEVCAYLTGGNGGTLYIAAAGRELSGLTPGIRNKLKASLDMFTNGRAGRWIEKEKIYFSDNESGAVPTGGPNEIESYFLVPVSSSAAVAGVLFFGSIRRDAFLRDTISRFRVLAGDGSASETEECACGETDGMLEQLLLSIPYGAAIVDSDGSVTRVNQAFRSILGGESFSDVDDIGESCAFDIRSAWDEFIRFGSNITDRRIESSAGDGRSISLSMILMESTADEARSVIVVRDDSELTGMELERDEAMAVVAHEIRTPMTALKNSLSILSGADLSGDGPGRRFFETALRTVDRLSVLVDGLLDASMVRRSGGEPMIERVDIGTFLEDSSILFASSMAKKDISFRIDVDGDIRDAFMDRDMMEQVIQNLLSNSLKHVPAGGDVSIGVKAADGVPEWISEVLPAGYARKTRYLIMTIADSGPGIPEAVARGINVPFTAPPSSIKPAKGIGLYIAARLVKLHGGRLIIDAGKDGSSIDIYLPADIETSDTMRGIISIQSSVDSLVSTGASPVLYVLTREGGPCWLDIAGKMRERPVVDPSPSETGRSGIAFWPMSKKLAFALSAERRYRESPMALFENGRGGLRMVEGGPGENPAAGWSLCPDDGRDFASLLKVAMERMKGGAEEKLPKGDEEWTATGSLS